jgi:AcrR family transcriptional regulator
MARISASAKETVRRQLLRTAAEHFARYGLDAASVDAISLDAGFAKGTLYNYFKSKEHLFAEVLTEACRRALQLYEDRGPRTSVRERLSSLVAADVEVLRQEEEFLKVLIREAMSFRQETYPLVVEHLGPFRDKVEEILSQGVVSGEIRAKRPLRQLALVFVGLLTTLYVQHWGSGGNWPSLEEVPDLAAAVFLDGVCHETHSGGRR